MSKQTEALKLALGYLDRLVRGLGLDADSEAVKVVGVIREALAEQPAHESAYQRGYMDGIAKGLRMEQPAQQQEPVASKQTFTRAEVIRAIEAERHACSIAVWMTLMEATEPDADDKGLAGWMTEAEQRIKNRSSNDPEAAQQQEAQIVRWKCPCGNAVTFRGFTEAPASKPWVGLTDEEMRGLEKQFNAERVRTSDEEYLIIYPGDYWAWQRAIEAKLREKNA